MSKNLISTTKSLTTVLNGVKTFITAIPLPKGIKGIKLSFQVFSDHAVKTITADSFSNGLKTIKEFTVPIGKKAIELRPTIIELVHQGMKQKDIAHILNISQSTVSRVLHKK